MTHSLTSAELDRLEHEITAKADAAEERGDSSFARGLRDTLASIANARRVSFIKRAKRKDQRRAAH
jgi:hypothetical protein